MKLVPVILLDRNTETRAIAEALRPWRILEDTITDPHFLDKTGVFFRRFNERTREIRLKDVPELRMSLTALRSRLEQDLELKVESAQGAALPGGAVPLILNPKQALAALKEIRESQIVNVDLALVILRRVEILMGTVTTANDILTAFRHTE
jgi:hypothetical protein